MRIGLLAEKKNDFIRSLAKDIVQRGHSLQILDGPFLEVATFDGFDLLLLKTKSAKFLAAAYRAKSRGVTVIPDPAIAEKLRNRRLCDHFLDEAGIRRVPSAYDLRENLIAGHYDYLLPGVAKPLLSSGGKGLRMVWKWSDLAGYGSDPYTPIYVQKFIAGKHYRIDFIGDDVYLFEKIPVVGDDPNPRHVAITHEFVQVVRSFKTKAQIEWGDLDVVVDRKGQIFQVDPGTFPSFRHVPKPTEAIARQIIDLVENRIGGASHKGKSVTVGTQTPIRRTTCKKCTAMLVEIAVKRSRGLRILHRLSKWGVAAFSVVYRVREVPGVSGRGCARCLKYAKNSLKARSRLFAWANSIIDPYFDKWLAKAVTEEETRAAREIAEGSQGRA